MSAGGQETSADVARVPVPLWRQPAFVRFWLGRFTSHVAGTMITVAVGWQMYELTGSALDLGLVGLVQFLPGVGLMLVAGVVADRYDRRLVMRIAQLSQVAGLAALTVANFAGLVTPAVLYLTVFVFGAARAFENPTMHALLPAVVPPEDFPRAVAASSSGGQAAVIVGPAIGGFAYLAGPGFVYGSCAVLIALASVFIGLIRIARNVPSRERPTLDTLLAGIRYIRAKPVLLGAISLDMFAVLLGGATALMPIFARDILEAGPIGLGMLRSAPGVGALAMSLWLAHRPFQHRVGHKLFAGIAVFGVATIVFGLSESFVLSLASLVVLGASDMVSVVIRLSIVQLETPDDMRGRVSAVNSLFIGSSNQLGEFESGVTAEWFGPRAATVLGGVGTLAVVALWARLFPTLYGRDRLDTRPRT